MITHLAGFFIAFAMTGAGLFFCRWVRVPFTGSFERLVFSAALGTGLTAYLVLILGSSGVLRAPVYWLIFTLLAFCSFASMRREIAGLCFFSALKTAPRWALGMALFPAVVLIFTSFGVAAPETGHDALSYHLVQPLRYLREGRIFEVPFSTHTLWPSLMQMLFTLGILLKDSSLAKFFHFFLFLCTAGALYAFLKPTAGKKTAFFAAVIYLTVPGFYIQASFSYVDNALACFSFLSFYALYRFFETRHLSWALLAGAFSGLALSVKLIGLFLLPLIAVFFLYEFVRTKKDRRLIIKAAFIYAVMLVVFGAAWYIRSAVLRGNPVFPFYPDIFGGHGWNDPTYVNAHGRGQGMSAFLLLLWDMTLHPQWFGGEHLGPIYLALLPILLFARPIHASVRTALFFGAGYAVIWFVTDQNVRFFYPALVFLTAGAAYALAFYLDLSRRFLRGGAFFPVFFLLAVQSSFAGYHFYKDAPFFLRPDAHAYLMEKERSYRAARAFDAVLQPDDQILSAGEVRGYYFKSVFVQEGEFHLFTHYDQSHSSPGSIARYLKSQGFTHVMLAEVDPDYARGQGSFRIARILKENKESGLFFHKIAEASFPVDQTRYRLYQINV